MTGGQDRAAAVRRIALAAAVRSDRICQAMGSTATPRLKTGALQLAPRRLLPSGIPPALRPGGLIPNPLVSAGDGPPVRLDTILAGRTAVLTARRPDAALMDYCRRHGLVLVRISSTSGTDTPAGPGPGEDATWIDVRLAGDAPPAGMRALVADPALTVIVRPDRVIAAAQPGAGCPGCPGTSRPMPCPGIWHRLPRQPAPSPPVRCRPPVKRLPCSAPSRCLPAPRGRQADRQAEVTAVRCALRGPPGPATGSSGSRTRRRRRRAGLRQHPPGLAAAARIGLLLLGALITHRRAEDGRKEMAPAPARPR
jgi:hypothetical protein